MAVPNKKGSEQELRERNALDKDGVQDIWKEDVQGASSEPPNPHSGERQKMDDINTWEHDTLVNVRPDKDLDNALDRQRDSERQVFDSLITENVKLSRCLEKSEASFQELLARYDLRDLELDAEKEKCAILEAEKRELEKVRQKAKPKKPGVIIGSNDAQARDKNDVVDDDDNNNNTTEHDREPYERKVSDLQLRLLRLTEDCEDKERRIELLEADSRKNDTLVAELEKHVPSEVVEQVRENQSKRNETPIQRDRCQDIPTNMVRTGASVHDSKVCTIL